MALVTMKELLERAKNNHRGIGAFSVGNMEMVKGAIQAAEELTDLTLFADTTSLELFINKGSQVFTTRVYGKQGKAGLKGQCDARIQVYEMSGYEYGRI